MNLKNINLIAWKTFRHNSDKSALFLEISTVFCLSLCFGLILGLNAIFSDLLEKSKHIVEINSPLITHELKDIQSVYKIHEGLSVKDDELIKSINIPGLEFTPVKKNIVTNENKENFIVMPTKDKALCLTNEEITQFTIFDLSEGMSIVGTPLRLASFKCEWQQSNIPIIHVPEKIWNRVYGDKKFMYSVGFTNLKNVDKKLQSLVEILKNKEFIVVNKSLQGMDFMRISILQKKIFDIVFSLLCLLLLALMMMNCMIFIKNRRNDWKLFYLFQVKEKYTNAIIVFRFLLIFATTVAFSFLFGLIVANTSTEIVEKYLIGHTGNITLGYKFELNDILFTYSLMLFIFLISTIVTINGIKQANELNSKPATTLEIRNLNVSYNTLTQGNIQILKDVSLKVMPCRLTAIVGISGSGKTTLLNSIFNNKYLDNEVLIEIESTAYVTQYPNLVQELTIAENLNLFSKSDKLQELSKQFGITKILSHYPEETSVGERQRACIVRALLSKPTNIILDEPTASLDAANKILVINIIKDMVEEKELSFALIVTHDPAVVKMCDDIYELKNTELNYVTIN